VQFIKLPQADLMDLYEQIIVELLEIYEVELAKEILGKSLEQSLKMEYPERVAKLEEMARQSQKEAKSTESGERLPKEKSRRNLAEKIKKSIVSAQPSRLMSLLGQALKYQEIQGTLNPNIKLNIYTGEIPPEREEVERFPTVVQKAVKFSLKSLALTAKFSPNGLHLAFGCMDGLIEIWDPSSAKLKTDLDYQAEQRFMVHNAAVLSMAFSSDSELLCSGDKLGIIKL